MVRPMIPATARTAAHSGAFRRVAALSPVVEVWVGVSGLARPIEHMVNPVGTGGDAGLVESSPALNQWSIAEAVINQTPPSPLSRPVRDDDPPQKKKPCPERCRGKEEKREIVTLGHTVDTCVPCASAVLHDGRM